MFNRIKALRAKGIMGINRRVGEYILPLNNRKYFPIVDYKVLTEKYAREHDIPCPINYVVIKQNSQLKVLSSKLRKLDSFVIKPANGAMGNGIILITKVVDKGDGSDVEYYSPKGQLFTQREINYHISGILSGLYSLTGAEDEAIVQELIAPHKVFDDFSYKGIPDIRIIVCKGKPIMAMTRLPTKESDGKANLHQGAIGCGIELKTGQVTYGVYKTDSITVHPDTNVEITKLKIPHWEEILEMSAKAYNMTGLGYLGVDIVIDTDKGPKLLEVNARPGLAIQIANKKGLSEAIREELGE